MNLFKVLFYVLAIYLVLKLISRYVLPFLARLLLKKAQKKKYTERYSTTQDKDRVIYKEEEKESKADKDGKGEYIDFEEVD